ncbi:MAG: hypothetical protein JNL82_20130 [Myxococcales bacterium]|nr:hypothetical protein [Myxococcales bacterium]
MNRARRRHAATALCASPLVTLVFALACGDDKGVSTTQLTTIAESTKPPSEPDATPTSAGPDATDTGDTSSSTASTTPPPTSSDSTGPVDPSTSSTAPTSDSDDSSSFITTATSPTNPGGAANGSQCGSDDECQSGHCFIANLVGAFCSECAEDQDCVDAGAGISCSPDPDLGYAACAPGELGNFCMSEAACMPALFCTPPIDGGGLTPNTCGECVDAGDCGGGQLCSPVIPGDGSFGQTECVAPGSLPNDAPCPLDAQDGDAACSSGHCGDVSVMGVFLVPVCGECEADGDCPNGFTCTPGGFNGAFVGAVCE